MGLLEPYLQALGENRQVGVKETSSYGVLQTVFDEAGKGLAPRVRCVINPQNKGAGIPDGGFFTIDQLRDIKPTDAFARQLPARGVMEVKGTSADVEVIAKTEQVGRYLAAYGLVLVTNYRDFLLLGQDVQGNPEVRERYSLAPDEATFWATPKRKLAVEHEATFVEFLKRVLLHRAPIAAPEDVAFFLASYARDARSAIEQATTADLFGLELLKDSLEHALGVKFEGDRGEHFYHSTLVQTLFYGVFSAWVLWSRDKLPTDRTTRFDWRPAAWNISLPVIQTLFGQIATPENLHAIGLDAILDRTTSALNRIDRAAFFARFEMENAVQYFYEPFLSAFDPELRKNLGVWYTPPEIVQYMVAQVDRMLREELGIARGLADDQVIVLDPCCGTGAYLVETLRVIARRLKEEGNDAFLPRDLRRAASDRIFGFEILSAPFVIAHMQITLLLRQFGTVFQGQDRAGIFLTNALTDWDRIGTSETQARFPQMDRERNLAGKVKKEARVLVVLGNPPYNGYAGVGMEEEQALSNAYRTVKQVAPPQGQGLNDLYIRFFRMAERRIVEQTGKGIVCYISNYSWLDGLSHTGMRERYLEAFDSIWIDCLNGDKYKTGKLTPEGAPDPSVFSMESNPEGIQVGTAIATLLRREADRHHDINAVQFRHFWGKSKRTDLIASLTGANQIPYQPIVPPLELGLPFMPTQLRAEYLTWPRLPELFPVSFPGVKTSRDDVLVDIDRDRLMRRMKDYFNPDISHEELRRIIPGVMEDSARFAAISTREELQKRGFLPQNIVRYSYRPFDNRWLYWEPLTKLLDEKRAEYFPNVLPGNLWIGVAQHIRREYDPPIVTAVHASLHVNERGANLFPLFLKPDTPQGLFASLDVPDTQTPQPNLSDRARGFLAELGAQPDDLYHHIIAILHAPWYGFENAGALRQDWPRIPLPGSREQLHTSAELGRQVADLLDIEKPVSGLGQSTKLRRIGQPARVNGGAFSGAAGEFALTVGWGHRGDGGATMPGRGRIVTRDRTPDELADLHNAGLDDATIERCLGQQVIDVYLNDEAYWGNVPERVWDYTLGGYQVVKKWLSYRERAVLGRDLTEQEVRYDVPGMVRRITALLLLGPALDANYRAVASTTSV